MWKSLMAATRVFIHGLESTSRGTKGAFFRKHFPGMILEDFSGPFPARMQKLEDLLASESDLILVGSSYGGLMASVYACLHEDRVKKLILLAPALHLEPFKPYQKKKLHMPVFIFHGLNDDVVPLEAVQAIAGRIFVNQKFKAVDDDHSLRNTFAALDWDALLQTAQK
jgi:pimeloyl-ACP methyl ester carboxylesterase